MNGTSSSCVEVAQIPEPFGVRDSKNPTQAACRCRWTTCPSARRVKRSELDFRRRTPRALTHRIRQSLGDAKSMG
ncbi:DUF397 domain-containing protein [Actinomadura alba]|uniref:DUF397 domain-containing protein n=1 Tax=Actinomadura alba TaxID=406431 RepID=A0ABR7LKY3_9ACTN|nr:DUF397 domain-containing protein [Actinomadura alba]